jgi:glutathione S-transferase
MRDINPKGSVPALKLENGQVITESLIVAQYIIEEYGAKTTLLPDDALQRATIRLFIDWFGKEFIPVTYKSMRAEPGDATAIDELLQATRAVS